MTHRIRKALEQGNPEFLVGIVEVAETYAFGTEHNQHERHNQCQGRGLLAKRTVVGTVQSNGAAMAAPALVISRQQLERFLSHSIQREKAAYEHASV